MREIITKKLFLPLAKWILGIAALVFLMVYLSGVLTPDRVKPGTRTGPSERLGNRPRAVAEIRAVPIYHEAVGSVRSRRRIEVASQTSGRILSVEVREGNKVEKGTLLARIESDVLDARLEQARRGLEAARAAELAAANRVSGAEAAFNRTSAEHDRVKALLQEKAATPREAEAAEADYRQSAALLDGARAFLAGARAETARTRGQVREAEVALAYTEVRAPEGGEVVDRLVDPGDLAWAGRPLLVLHDPQDLRLEAGLREGLIGHITVDSEVRVHIEALGADLAAKVDEIVPSADPASRTFLVKAALSHRKGLRTGMFGRMRLSLGEREAVVVPAGAVRRIGQLEQVLVVEDDLVRKQFVRTGQVHGKHIEVLSGLKGGESVVIEKGE